MDEMSTKDNGGFLPCAIVDDVNFLFLADAWDANGRFGNNL
jgi:hypothetical protein